LTAKIVPPKIGAYWGHLQIERYPYLLSLWLYFFKRYRTLRYLWSFEYL